MKSYLTIVLVFVFVTANVMDFPLPDERETWAYNKMLQMSVDEKVGQLFILRVHSDWSNKDLDFIEKDIKKYQIGGIAFFQGTITDQVNITNRFQKSAKIPMFIAIDAEWGLGMRLKDGISFPKQLTLGAVSDNKLIYSMGLEIGRQLKRIGVNINYAPVADINNNPENPVINDRSFGENKYNVSEKTLAYMKGLQAAGIIACAKHFPGHGYADVDSHLDLPVLGLSRERFKDVELLPFRTLIKNDVKSIMTAHLQIPSFDNRRHRPSSLSKKIVNGILRDSLNYEGLIMTDALAMKGVAGYYNSGEAAVEAFLAGNDILELPENLHKAFDAVKKAVHKGKISRDRLEKSLMRILLAKYDQGYYLYKPVNTSNLIKEINTPDALALKENLYRKSVTVLGNKFSFLPLLPEDYGRKIAVLSLGSDDNTVFQKRFSTYCSNNNYNAPLQLSNSRKEELLTELEKFDRVIIGLHNFKKRSNENFGLSGNVVELISELNKKTTVCLAVFGTPYCLQIFNDEICTVLAYENDVFAQDMAAQAILGAFEINGKLPVSIPGSFSAGAGEDIGWAKVIGYSMPEYVGVNGDFLNKNIDRLAQELIDSSAAPGCQILVAKNGNIIFEKCYGYFTYDSSGVVKPENIYDLASVTKVLSTNLAVMKLHDEQRLSIFNKISDYLDNGVRDSNKKDISIIDALSHHSGLAPWLPVYKSTFDTINGIPVPSEQYYRNAPNDLFSVRVGDNMYMRKDFIGTMWLKLLNSPVNPRGKYKYSDLGLIMVKEMVEKITGLPLNEYVDLNFYKPLGLKHTTYKPLEKFSKNSIIPSENDNYWRKQIVCGYVHDMYADMLGGVSGHAGLFSNSRDMARLGQMMINGGIYGNKRYFNYPTVYTFTTRFYISTRRGIGWDMKELDKNKECNMSELASPSTYGHYGFTGTGIWIDPENELIYIFLSNRTFPTMENNKLSTLNFRPKIQSVIYESIKTNNTES